MTDPATPRPRGRPRRGATVATATVTLRLEPADMARLRAAAAEAGMPPATLVHRMVLRALMAIDIARAESGEAGAAAAKSCWRPPALEGQVRDLEARAGDERVRPLVDQVASETAAHVAAVVEAAAVYQPPEGVEVVCGGPLPWDDDPGPRFDHQGVGFRRGPHWRQR